MLRMFLPALSAIIICLFSASLYADQQARPDIVLITIDTLRPDHLGCYGYQGQTSPAIDAIAATSLVFEKAYATAPLTLPSHASILTGVYPASHGFRDNAFFPTLKYPLLAGILKQHGYHTAAFVSGAPLASKFGLSSGFDLYDDHFNGTERKADVTTDRAIRWWQSLSSPRFLWVHYFDPHSEYDPPSPFHEKFSKSLYDGEIAFVDRELSKLTAITPNAVLIITADHGESLGEHDESTHGVFLYNSTLRVPLILRAPGVQAATRNDPVTLCDVFPTILDLAKISLPQNLKGTSLLKIFPHRTLFAESLYAMRNFGYSSVFAAIKEDGKYIHSPEPEFYDLFRDPVEKNNRIASADLAKWKRDVQEYMQSASTPKVEKTMSAEDLEKLRSLGYIGGALTEKWIDPKSKVSVIEKFNSAMVLLKLEKYREAEKQFRSLTQTEPQNSLGFRFLADAVAAQKKYDEAREAYSTSLKIRSDPEVAIQLAKAHSRTGQILQAEQVLRKTMEEFPDYLDAKFELVSLYASQNRYPEAFRLLDREEPSYRNQRGILYLRRNKPASALVEFEAALRNEQKPTYWNNAGIAYARLKRLDDAQRAYENALSMNPEYSECEVNLALLLIEQSKYGEAIKHLGPLTERNPDLFQARLMLGLALENMGEGISALRMYRDLLAAVPADWPQKQQLLKRIERLSNQP